MTLLPRDGILSIDDARFYDIEEAEREYDPEELILGVELSDGARDYSASRDPYLSYYASGQAGIIGERHQDKRLPTKQFAAGAALKDEAVAYAFSVLSLEPVVNDHVGDTQLLVVFGVDQLSTAVFDRQVGNQTLTFSLSDPEMLTLTDAETGSTWEGLDGAATGGPLAGEQLAPLRSTNSFWFGRKDFCPNTRVCGKDG